jgi:hypothetical protein
VLNVVFNLLATLFHLTSLLLFIPFLRLLLGSGAAGACAAHRLWTREGLGGHLQLGTYTADRFQWANGCAARDQHRGRGDLPVQELLPLPRRGGHLQLPELHRPRHSAAVYDKMLELPLRYHSGERKGDLLALITNDMHVMEYSVMFYIEMVFREPIAILLFLGTMITIAPQLTLVALVLLADQRFPHRAHQQEPEAQEHARAGERVQTCWLAWKRPLRASG